MAEGGCDRRDDQEEIGWVAQGAADSVHPCVYLYSHPFVQPHECLCTTLGPCCSY